MLKWLVGIAAGVIGFLIAFSFTSRDEIAAEVDARLQSDFAGRCVARLERQMPDPSRAADICACMETEFTNRGYEITDAFGEDLEAMQEVTRSCAQMYGVG